MQAQQAITASGCSTKNQTHRKQLAPAPGATSAATRGCGLKHVKEPLTVASDGGSFSGDLLTVPRVWLLSIMGGAMFAVSLLSLLDLGCARIHCQLHLTCSDTTVQTGTQPEDAHWFYKVGIAFLSFRTVQRCVLSLLGSVRDHRGSRLPILHP